MRSPLSTTLETLLVLLALAIVSPPWTSAAESAESRAAPAREGDDPEGRAREKEGAQEVKIEQATRRIESLLDEAESAAQRGEVDRAEALRTRAQKIKESLDRLLRDAPAIQDEKEGDGYFDGEGDREARGPEEKSGKVKRVEKLEKVEKKAEEKKPRGPEKKERKAPLVKKAPPVKTAPAMDAGPAGRASPKPDAEALRARDERLAASLHELARQVERLHAEVEDVRRALERHVHEAHPDGRHEEPRRRHDPGREHGEMRHPAEHGARTERLLGELRALRRGLDHLEELIHDGGPRR
jgi:molecular chaperone GrpE (heat shock protein)